MEERAHTQGGAGLGPGVAARVWRPTPDTAWGRLVHGLRHPAVVSLLFLLFVASAVLLPKEPPDESRAVQWGSRAYRAVEAWVMSSRAKPMVNVGPRRDFAWIYLRVEDGRAERAHLEDVSWDEQKMLLDAGRGVHVMRVGWVREVHRTGLWAPWFERWFIRVTTTPTHTTPGLSKGADEPPSAEASRVIAETAAADILQTTQPDVAHAIRAGNVGGRRVVWHRVAWNVGTVVLFGLLVHGLVMRRQYVAQRAWRRGVCARCEYFVMAVPALNGVRICPECGTAAPVRER